MWRAHVLCRAHLPTAAAACQWLVPSQLSQLVLGSACSTPLTTWHTHQQQRMSSSMQETISQAKPNPSRIRNVCIIAHIDHGKTTLADRLLSEANTQYAGASSSSSSVAVPAPASLDSGVIERERGITILSKVSSFVWKDHVINLVDTPGHADFGGEVERVLGLVDGALLVVDASEGPLAQTKFVLGKALARGLSPMLVLNKCDKPGVTPERCSLVESAMFDLMASLGATDAQLDFPVIYASARQSWASSTLPEPGQVGESVGPILDALLARVQPPAVDITAAFSMGVAMIERDSYVGRIATGRVASGVARPGDLVRVLTSAGTQAEQLHKIIRVTKRVGMQDIMVDCASAGDIVSLAGVPAAITNTIADPSVTQPLDPGLVDPPTLSMVLGASSSPFAGREGKAVTGRVIGDRLMAEAETSVSLYVTPVAGGTERFEVRARGELQLGVLLEGMRRDGMELEVSPPMVLTKVEDGVTMEPMEEVTTEVDQEMAGQVINNLSLRKGELLDMVPAMGGRQRLTFKVPSRGLIGFKSLFVNLTRGEGLLARAFIGYEPFKGPFANVRKGALVSTAEGPATKFALTELAQRGQYFVQPGDPVYCGQIVGEHIRDDDLEINVSKAKHLTNVRSNFKDDTVNLAPPRLLSLEEAIGHVAPDELIEVTPQAIRIRKQVLDSDKRKQLARQAKQKLTTN